MTTAYNAPAIDALQRTRALIDTPHKWTRLMLWSKREDGQLCYCILGALLSTAPIGTDAHDRAHSALAHAAWKRCGSSQLGDYNDARSTTHDDVLSLVDEAIRSLQS